MSNRNRNTWQVTKIENKVVKICPVYMDGAWAFTLLHISVSASTEKLQLKIEGGRGSESRFLVN